MNERFFSLPEEKQQAIINAGYRVFSRNTYKNSPMSEIARDAGISKSLLFHYFHNKKELYLFLWDKCAQITIEHLTRYGCYSRTGLFESMEQGMRAKMEIARMYPDMTSFTIRAFYEKDPEDRLSNRRQSRFSNIRPVLLQERSPPDGIRAELLPDAVHGPVRKGLVDAVLLHRIRVPAQDFHEGRGIPGV